MDPERVAESLAEHLGRVVREAWVEWAKEQPDPKPSWLIPWEQLSESQREVDMRIGLTVAKELLDPLEQLADGKLKATAQVGAPTEEEGSEPR
jgi:hypothetical protein